MSLIATLGRGIKLALNENDHNPPHLHMKCPEGIFKIFFDYRIEVITGSARKANSYLQDAIKWMQQHTGELEDRWAAKEAGRKVLPIK